jgi:hypothetical protein
MRVQKKDTQGRVTDSSSHHAWLPRLQPLTSNLGGGSVYQSKKTIAKKVSSLRIFILHFSHF